MKLIGPASKYGHIEHINEKRRESRKDPAFKKLSKLVGPVYDQNQLEEAKKLNPNSIFKDMGLHRYRRLVASPDPIYITGSRAVKELIKRGYVVITAGGGGIPAVKDHRRTIFVDAVVDKDLASEKIATSIGASKFVSVTMFKAPILIISAAKDY